MSVRARAGIQQQGQGIQQPLARVVEGLGLEPGPEAQHERGDQPVAPGVGLRTLVDAALGVVAQRGEFHLEPAALEPKQHLTCQRDQLPMAPGKIFARHRGTHRVQLERHAGRVMPHQFQHIERQPGGIERLQPLVALTATPVVLPQRGQDDVPQRQLRLGQVPAHKIRILGRELVASQALRGEQQAAGPVHPEPGRLV